MELKSNSIRIQELYEGEWLSRFRSRSKNEREKVREKRERERDISFLAYLILLHGLHFIVG